jgi:hypothetical protein
MPFRVPSCIRTRAYLFVATVAIVLVAIQPGVSARASAAMEGGRPGAAAVPLRAGVAGLENAVLRLALDAASCAVRAGAVADPPTLTVIDYSRPSTEKRLFVLDLRSGALLFRELVAHGAGSGDRWATSFSNTPETHRTSLGLFVTADTYRGAHGYSLRLDGLEPGVNDRARERLIVMHGAEYVSDAFVRVRGRLGRSWGCPALPVGSAPAIIDRVKGGGLVFAYYPDRDWLESSRYLGACRAAG